MKRGARGWIGGHHRTQHHQSQGKRTGGLCGAKGRGCGSSMIHVMAIPSHQQSASKARPSAEPCVTSRPSKAFADGTELAPPPLGLYVSQRANRGGSFMLSWHLPLDADYPRNGVVCAGWSTPLIRRLIRWMYMRIRHIRTPHREDTPRSCSDQLCLRRLGPLVSPAPEHASDDACGRRRVQQQDGTAYSIGQSALAYVRSSTLEQQARKGSAMPLSRGPASLHNGLAFHTTCTHKPHARLLKRIIARRRSRYPSWHPPLTLDSACIGEDSRRLPFTGGSDESRWGSFCAHDPFLHYLSDYPQYCSSTAAYHARSRFRQALTGRPHCTPDRPSNTSPHKDVKYSDIQL